MDKLSVVRPDNGLLFSVKKKWVIKPWKAKEKPQKRITKWKKPIWKGYIVHGSNNTTFWKAQNYGKVKGSVVARGWGWEEGRIGRVNRGFLGQWKYSE